MATQRELMARAEPTESTGVAQGRDPASFRDPSGFVFLRDGEFYRQVNKVYAEEWDAFVASGLADRLTSRGWMIPIAEADLSLAYEPGAHRVVRPERLDFVSYPYEWTFGQLKDAALLTLDIASEAAAAGFSLKDASSYNMQFHRGRPIHIDSLSFERAVPGQPWTAYRQFCEHFLAPLALMAYVDIRFGRMLRSYLDGFPLELASHLLPRRTWLRFGLAAHLHLHARAQRHYAGRRTVGTPRASMSTERQQALLASLSSTVARLEWQPAGTEWAEYAEHTSYGAAATASKERLVGQFVTDAGGRVVWDLGANTGHYSRIAAGAGRRVVAFDIDPAAAERTYRAVRAEGRADLLPLIMDLADPSPGIGWGGEERASLVDRADADTALALALVHHLAIGRNVPLRALGDFLARLAPNLILEWVPKSDEMVQVLLASRPDIFPDYTLAGLRQAFAPRFELAAEAAIEGSQRMLLRFRRRDVRV